ncbi:MAG: hypothetical protein SPJ69_05570 [Campylobacter sp.]|uniref:hypothetical protein n=1 Tax=Campylobacter sp. TaxID=205 RepID=UPI0029746A8F|nr:hypothetical protein [Campylobacter sp.]MDD7600227.1 hypothetical protein [Campylobacteraceae bacterium]MDY5887772.1 hypothetical protein [Campylobacter sp.]
MKFQRVREKLRAMRKEAKLSLHKLALISGFNENTIKGYETIASISSNYVYFCSFYFGYTMDSIQDDTKELEKMSQNEQTLRIYKEIKELDIIDFYFFLYFYGDFDVDEYAIAQEHKHDIAANEYEKYINAILKDGNLNEILENYAISTNDYTPSKYAEFVRLQNANQKLRKSNFEIQSIDLELLALLNSLDAEVKDNLKALIKSIIAKGGKM